MADCTLLLQFRVMGMNCSDFFCLDSGKAEENQRVIVILSLSTGFSFSGKNLLSELYDFLRTILLFDFVVYCL